MALDIEKGLTMLGDNMRKTQIDHLTEFLMTSVLCPFRQVTMYRWDIKDRKHYAFKCVNPKLKDPQFGWSCAPSNCPYIGHLPGSVWEYEIKKDPERAQIEVYAEAKRTKNNLKRMRAQDCNVMSATGLIHKLIEGLGCLTPACDKNYHLGYGGMWGKWVATDPINPINCKHCLKDWRSDGRSIL